MQRHPGKSRNSIHHTGNLSQRFARFRLPAHQLHGDSDLRGFHRQGLAPNHAVQSVITWAFLLPGALGLGGLAFGARRRRWLSRLMLVALVGLVTLLGTTACNPRYYYLNHGPPTNPATPAGTYNVLVTAQASNGVTALTQHTTIVLVVN